MDNIRSQTQLVVDFPMLCLLSHFDGEGILALNNSLAEIIRHSEATKDADWSGTYTQGGYHTRPDFLDSKDPAIAEYKREILIPAVISYMTQYYNMKHMPKVRNRVISPNKLDIQGWGNIMRKGDWNAPHNHTATDNRVSAVYYIKTPKCPRPEGALQFENPNSISVNHGDYGSILFHPTEGDLILFPCYLMHFSHPFKSDDERILIANDIKVDDEFKFSGENNYISMNIGGG